MNTNWHDALLPHWGTIFSSDLQSHFLLAKREGDVSSTDAPSVTEPSTAPSPTQAAVPNWEAVQRAAEQGNAMAQYYLGALYATGTGGVAQNTQEAAAWYHKAAEQGLAIAQNNLGFLYATGQGVGQDYVVAYQWTTLAMAGGYADAANNLNLLAQHMTSIQIEQAQQLAQAWTAGHPQA
ncbi:MAG: sel1 repeat family protein [Magnetococcales bacterium]|nr:sel1 repeat family protein [Magnetococcales bacterium]